jgi:hypothetical protein
MKQYPKRKGPVDTLKDIVRSLSYTANTFGLNSLACPYRNGLRCDHNLNTTDTCEWMFCKLNEEV